MAKRKTQAAEAPESAREAPAAMMDTSQDTPEAETASESLEKAPGTVEEAGLVRYRVASPGGVYLRQGPGRAYHPLAVLPAGTEAMGVDLAGMLRVGRKPGEAAWLKVIAREGSGWVDSAFLERIC